MSNSNTRRRKQKRAAKLAAQLLREPTDYERQFHHGHFHQQAGVSKATVDLLSRAARDQISYAYPKQASWVSSPTWLFDEEQDHG